MDTLWGFAGWWCLIPLSFMVVAMVACALFMSRRGGCGGAAIDRCCAKGETHHGR